MTNKIINKENAIALIVLLTLYFTIFSKEEINIWHGFVLIGTTYIIMFIVLVVQGRKFLKDMDNFDKKMKNIKSMVEVINNTTEKTININSNVTDIVTDELKRIESLVKNNKKEISSNQYITNKIIEKDTIVSILFGRFLNEFVYLEENSQNKENFNSDFVELLILFVNTLVLEGIDIKLDVKGKDFKNFLKKEKHNSEDVRTFNSILFRLQKAINEFRIKSKSKDTKDTIEKVIKELRYDVGYKKSVDNEDIEHSFDDDLDIDWNGENEY